MKRILSIVFVFVIVIVSHAQELSVTDFHLDQMDQTANLQGTTVMDQNGEKCALIKVITTETGFTFDVGTLGVMKTEQKTGEIWLYVPRGIRRITLNHQQFGRLEYPLPVAIKGARTYQMTLKADRPVVSDEKQPLNIKLSPASATILVDGDPVETSGGKAKIDLLVGNHTYNVFLKGYINQTGSITIRSGQPGNLNIELIRKVSQAQALTPKKEVAKKKEPEKPAGDNVSEVPGVGLLFSLGKVQFLMVEVEHGTFTLGAHGNQSGAMVQELPAHQVTLTKDYYMGETEVTQELWQEVMGNNPSYDKGSRTLPVEQVSWDNCQAFCQELSKRTGRTFRLPTNAEWEYAARGGNKSKGYIWSGSNKVREVAWIDANSQNTTHTVKQLAPNELGLYDMSGNVWEWCQDLFGTYRNEKQVDPITETTNEEYVIRGGSVAFNAVMARTSNRYYASSYDINNTFGMRLLMEK